MLLNGGDRVEGGKENRLEETDTEKGRSEKILVSESSGKEGWLRGCFPLELVMIVQLEMSHDIGTTTQLCTLLPLISGLHLPLVLVFSFSSAQNKVRRSKKPNQTKPNTKQKASKQIKKTLREINK